MAAALAARAFLLEPVQVELTQHLVPVPDLPPAWEGAQVLHLSDLHYGDPRSEWLMRLVRERVLALRPRLIVITGDFIVRFRREVNPVVRHVAALTAPGGVLAVLGDHDFYRRTDVPVCGIDAALERFGVRVLRNSAVTLPGGLRVAGTDPTTKKVWCANLPASLAAAGGIPHLLLTHSPDLLPEASAAGVPLMWCGHTHGGQVVVPCYGPPVTHTVVGRHFASGWVRWGVHGTRAYVNRGLASHASLRFLCRPEMALHTLVRA